MKEIKSLIERAKKYLRSAEVLLGEGDYESSVSRTYYAMFILHKPCCLRRIYHFHLTKV